MRADFVVWLLLTSSAVACGRQALDVKGGAGAPGAGGGAGGTSGTADDGGADSGVAGTPGVGVDGGTDSMSVPDGAVGRVPSMHRPTGVVCPMFPPPTTQTVCALEDVPSCRLDSDCSGGKDGHCIPASNSTAACACTYDACFSDGDCPAGDLCVCSGSFSGNTCVKGSCRVDADCGPGGFCSPVFPVCSRSGPITDYACHTPADKCFSDSDCSASPSQPVCAFDSAARVWSCKDTIPTCCFQQGYPCPT